LFTKLINVTVKGILGRGEGALDHDLAVWDLYPYFHMIPFCFVAKEDRDRANVVAATETMSVHKPVRSQLGHTAVLATVHSDVLQNNSATTEKGITR